jgi:hypothetical protein
MNDVRDHLESCNACMAHFVARGRFIQQACEDVTKAHGSTPSRWMRFYFSRFHADGHKAAA